MDGTELNARFAIKPNELKHCGPEDAHSFLSQYLKLKTGKQEAQYFLKKFEALHPFLQLIAEENGRDKFDYEVAEAYWIGNELLDNIPYNRTEELMRKFLPGILVPRGAQCYHNMSVLLLGTGWIKGDRKMDLPNIERCMVSYGKISTYDDKEYTIEGPVVQGRELVMKERDVQRFVDARPGDYVAVHHGTAVSLLEERQTRNIEYYTRRALESIRSVIKPN